MLYKLLKIIIRTALHIFCRRIYVHGRAQLAAGGPLLLAVNHPNSFLDAVIVAAYCRGPVYFLARGDAFHRPWARKMLTFLGCIPVYRLSEGRQYLHLNDQSFDQCLAVLRRKGTVLIFSEGVCENEWKLRPLKKGTARLALRAWQDPQIGSSLKVLPVGINYDHFKAFGKYVFLNAGQFILRSHMPEDAQERSFIALFNERLKEQLASLCFHLEDRLQGSRHLRVAWVNAARLLGGQENIFARLANKLHHPGFGQLPLPALTNFEVAWDRQQKKSAHVRRALYFIPACFGFVLNYPCWWTMRTIARIATRGSVFFDSAFFGLLLLGYPLYLLALAAVVYLVTGNTLSWLLLLIAPLTGWLAIQFVANDRKCRNQKRMDGHICREWLSFFQQNEKFPG